METTLVFINGWMDKEGAVNNTIQYYSATSKKEVLPFETRIELEAITLS